MGFRQETDYPFEASSGDASLDSFHGLGLSDKGHWGAKESLRQILPEAEASSHHSIATETERGPS
jgi:hypothetical protein